MNRIDLWFVWGAVVAGGIYLLTGLTAFVGRARFERRRQVLMRLNGILTGAEGQKMDPRARLAWAFTYLSSLPRRRVERLASDMALPREVEEVVCRHLYDRLGPARVRENAMGHRGERSRWARIAALRVLAFGQPDDAWGPLETALTDSDPDVVAASVAMLGNVRDVRAADLLLKALRVGSYSGSRISAFLDRFPHDLFSRIQPMTAHPGPMVRYWAAVLLGRYGNHDGVQQTLAALVRDQAPQVRKAAIESLAPIGGAVAIEAATAGLDDDVWFVRAHAARALGVLKHLPAAPAVAALLTDREWWVRHAAKVGLEAMGPETAPYLIPLLSHVDRFARNGAAEVLQNLGIFEQLLGEEIRGTGNPRGMQVLGLLSQAGGVRMSEAMLSRLTPEGRQRASTLLKSLGVQRAGAEAAI